MFLWRNKQNYRLIISKYPPYLFHCPYQVKVSDNFIEDPDALQTILVGTILLVELFKVGYRGKHHTHKTVRFTV